MVVFQFREMKLYLVMVDWWFIPALTNLVILESVMEYKLISKRERLVEDFIPRVCSPQ
jgi:hypothetical protein